MTKLEEFKSKLQEMFEIDKADLDFGIYRIMNQKRDAITKFMNTLEEDVKGELSNLKRSGAEDLKKELEERIKKLEDLEISIDEDKKVIELKNKLKNSIDIGTIESEVYSHLTNFFGRYYSEGDFISQRRYKNGVYALPYEGEEVKLHWANHDQYYIKTSENFNNYIVNLDEAKKLHFHIVEASTEKNNNKEAEGKERRFFLLEENPVEILENEVIIKFEYNLSKEKQDKLNIDSANTVLSFIEKENKELFNLLSKEKLNSEGKSYKKKLNRLEYELNNYTSKNSFDYFIHKDLGGFLRRELDFYIKNEVMFLDDLDEEKIKNSISKVRTIKVIGHKIIQMLEQIENFQKKLWEKRKFVVETNYCFTLDKIFEKFEEKEQNDIIEEILSNVDQLGEWKEMYDFDIEVQLKNVNKQDGLFKTEYSAFELLKQNDKLVIDTKYFSEEFKERVISAFSNLEEELNGTLIHSENFQALGLLQEKYKEQIKCIYIDPPYNTDSTPIIYKNGYRDSSWISLMNDRLLSSKLLLQEQGVFAAAIDDVEYCNLNRIIQNIYNEHRISTITVIHNPKGSITKDFNRVHEYTIFATKENQKNIIGRTIEKNDSLRKMRRWGENSLRTERRLSFYPIHIKEGKIIKVGKVPQDDFHPVGRNVILENNEIEIWPIDQEGIERRWNFGLDTIHDNLERVVAVENEGIYDLFLTHEITVPKTVWSGGEFDAGKYGNTLLIDIIGKKMFDFPKSINLVSKCINLSTQENARHIILDFFAGSGTTGHAVIDLNREDVGNRKYILVEMGEYFELVTKQRIKKAIYSKEWSNGKPQDISRYIKKLENQLKEKIKELKELRGINDQLEFEFKQQQLRGDIDKLNEIKSRVLSLSEAGYSNKFGISQIFKYIKLEQYEDTLNNLFVKEVKPSLFQDETFENEYMLNYMMEFETKESPSLLNIDMFKNPFEYKMKIIEKDEIKNKNIDLVETFNYLLGIDILSNTARRNFTFKEGKIKEDKEGSFAIKEVIGVNREGNKILVIWRNISADLITDNKFLEEYFRKMRISTLDMEYDYIYINGDNTLQNIRKDSENWKVILTEEKFKKLMFDEKVL